MANEGGRLRSGRGGRTAAEESLVAALRERFDDGETVEHGLRSTSPVVHEHRDVREVVRPGRDGSAVAVISDRQLYFAVGTSDGPEVIAVPYRDVRSVSAGDGFLESSLTVRVWNRGYYHFSPAGGEDVTAAAEALERFVDGWQRVLAALDAAREHITELGRHVENGDEDAAGEARDAVQRELSRAGSRIDDAPEPVRDALAERADETTTELQRRRVRAHVVRGKDLAGAGEELTEEEAWSDAAEAFRSARKHYETALSAAVERGFDTVEAIQAELEALESHRERLAVRPLELAEEARAAAQSAEDASAAIAAWDEALEYYRAALSAAWDPPTDVGIDTDALRWQVEWAARNLLDARRGHARDLEEKADQRCEDGLVESGRHDYRSAAKHLAGALEVARELRVGDPAAIRAQRERIREKLAAV